VIVRSETNSSISAPMTSAKKEEGDDLDRGVQEDAADREEGGGELHRPF